MVSQRLSKPIPRSCFVAILICSAVFAAHTASAAQLALTWVDNAGGTAYFEVERKTGTTGTYAQIATTGFGITTYADSTITVGTTFCYRVRASNTFGNSGYSNEACGSIAASLDLTVAKAGAGSGTVVSTPSGINCGSDCVESYAAGRIVTLTATPAAGSFFTGWSGGGCTGTGSCVIAGNAPATVTATFSPDGTSPSASITSPATGASVSGSVNVAVSAADNAAVTRVELWVDGALVATDTAAPWSFAWDSTAKPNGTHSLLAKAYDAGGNIGSSPPISVTVNNGPVVPAALTLAFTGQIRDRVGKDNGARAPDGALDGTFLVTLAPGSGARTVTQLELRRTGNAGIWDTVPTSSYWVLGVATSLDGPLLNTSSDSVNFPLAAGGSAVLFAADTAGLFAPGSAFTLTATFADGSTASASTTIAATPTLTLAFTGQIRDRVGKDNGARAPDGALDGTFLVTLAPGSGARTVTQLELRRTGNTGIWDTVPTSSYWVLGVATSLDGPLLNTSSDSVNFPLAAGGSAVLFAADTAGLFAPGSAFTLTATFADGSTASASTTIAATPTLTLAFTGQIRDRVGKDNGARAPDGALDGTFLVTLAPGSGARTVTQLELRRTGNTGIWDTVPTSIYWVLGVATSLDGPLLNTSSDSVNFPLAAGGSAVLFAADTAGLFAPGSAFTLTATFADGSTASASTTVSP